MYRQQLKTFIYAAETGSFSKTAKLLSISPAAVVKQIKLLEEEWQIPLFWRTHTGITLTPEGEQLYPDAKYIIQYSDSALARVKGKPKKQQELRIGVSQITSTPFLPEILPFIRKRCPNLLLRMVSFENKPEISRSMLNNLGQDIDLVIAMCDLEKKLSHNQLPLFEEPVCCAMSVSHPLAKKERLTIKDLSGQSLMIVARGRNSAIDRMRTDLEQNHPSIHLLDFTYYDLNTFNTCQQSKHLMMAIGRWSAIHPLLKIIPVDWPYTIPYGLHYAMRPSASVQEFVHAAKEIFSEGGELHV